MFKKKKYYILDGGTGQALLHKGLEAKGTLWSATALLQTQLHQLVIDTHLDFIHAGADLIVTNSFGVRQKRFEINNVADQYTQALRYSGELAQKARRLSGKDVIVAGGISTQNNTYQPELVVSEEIIKAGILESATILNPFVDLFYLDVFSNYHEIMLAFDILKAFDKPVLLGLYFKMNGEFPGGESITNILHAIQDYNCCGVIAACVAPEVYQLVVDELKKTNLPYGFKINAFNEIPEDYILTEEFSKQPTKVLGTRKEFYPQSYHAFVQQAKNDGATLLGGCCEITHEHIKALTDLK